MDESGDFWRSVTTEMAVRHNKRELAPPAAFQSVLAVAAAVMQRGTPQKKKSLTGKSGKAQPVPPTGIEPVRCFHRGILSPLRLPVPPRRLTVWYCSAKRGNCQSAKPCRPEYKKANGLFAANGCNLVRRTEKGRLRRRGWGLRWEKAQKGGKGTNLRGFFED